jgi:uncharacterized protein YoaH (UPF0181 family)
MSDNNTPQLQQAILQVVANQLRDNEPPATRETLQRLLREGCSETEAMRLIAHVVAAEVFGVLKEGRLYDESRFCEALRALPALPWEKK